MLYSSASAPTLRPAFPAGGALPGLAAALPGFLRGHLRLLERRSRAVPRTLARNIELIALGWMGIFLLASLPVIALSPTPAHSLGDAFELFAPYVLAAIAPLCALRLAIRSFPGGVMIAPGEIHLSAYGRWRKVSVVEARANPAFGPAGFMASLLVGLLLNIGMRGFEFLVAVPALGASAPAWGRGLFHLMAADLVIMNFFYMLCFVMALRAVPYFPKVLLFAWGLDILMQLLVASQIGPMAGLPRPVGAALHALLQGNIEKVLISAFVWLPYLMLSDRVNVTYRRRVRAVAL